LFPDDDPNEEPIKGDRIVDDDFPDGTGDRYTDIPEDQEKGEVEIDLDGTEEREEIDLEKVIQGEHVLPGEEKAETFVDLREAEEMPVVQRPDDEPPVIKKDDYQEDAALAPVIEIPAKPSETEAPVPPEPPPVRTRGRRKKSAPPEPPPPPALESAPAEEKAEEPGIIEDIVVPIEEKVEDDDLTLTPPEAESDRPSAVRIGNDTHDEIARLIADFEIRRRGLLIDDETELVPVEEKDLTSSFPEREKPIEVESAELTTEPEEPVEGDSSELLVEPDEPEGKEISVEEKRIGEPAEAAEFRWNRIESPNEEDKIKALDEENPEDEIDRDEAVERLPSLTGDTMEFQDDVMRKINSDSPAGPTMGIPETVSKLQEALPFTAPSEEVDIKKELEEIDLPGEKRKRSVDFRLDDFDLDKDLTRNDGDETENEGNSDSDEGGEAEDAEDEERISDDREGEKISARPPIVRLGFFRRVKALLFDLLIVSLFWIGATGLAAGFLSVPILDLAAAAAVPLALLFGALLTTYLFLFLFFLGETPGGRLVTPRDGNSAE
jgi:hypothetical protein